MKIILLFLLSYCIGSISFSLIVGKVFFKKDLREHGSGNLGTTNTFRILGKKAGIVVGLGDILKGTLVCFFPLWFSIDIHMIYFGIFAIIGHVFPIFSRFKGGKAVATTSGIVLAYNPLLFLCLFLLFLVCLYLTKIVSVSSISIAFSLFIYSLFANDTIFLCFSLFIFLFITFKHKDNIKRIRQGTEPKISWL